MDTLHQAYHTVPVHTPRIRLIRQSQQTPPASDWSKSHGGHSQPQTNHTVSVDTLQPQTGQTVPVDILNLGLIIHIGLLTTSDWLNFHIGLPASYWGDSSSASYNLRLIRQSQRTQHNLRLINRPGGHTKTSDWSDIYSRHPTTSYWSDSPTGHPTTSDWSNSRSGHPIYLNWSDIHSGHPNPQTDQTVPVPCNLRLIRQSQRTQHNLRLINRPGGHTKTSDWSDIHSRHPTTSGWSITLDTLQTEADQKFTVGHPSIRPIRQLKWTPPSFSAYSMNNTIFMFELDSTRRSWSK
jgi:hypothetical protein